MITRLYVNNFRCLVAFEMKFDSFGVLCGANGSGKSSVFDAIRLVRSLATGEGYLGGTRESDIPHLEFTNWQDSKSQEFELGITAEGHAFEYAFQLEQAAYHEKPRFVSERAVCDGKPLFDRNLDGVRFSKRDGTPTGFPLDWRQSALAAIQPKGSLEDLTILQRAMARLLILRPNPRGMEPESRSESQHPDLYLTNLVSWFRSLSQEQEWTDALRNHLQLVWPDFRSFRLREIGRETKGLDLRFQNQALSESGALRFDQLSDGEKALIGLYMVRASLETGATRSVLIDEPDNFVGLPELQPWVLSLRELIDTDRQAILISHHPEILNNSNEDAGHYFWRDSHTSPSRVGPLTVPEGLNAGEAVARGWVGVGERTDG